MTEISEGGVQQMAVRLGYRLLSQRSVPHINRPRNFILVKNGEASPTLETQSIDVVEAYLRNVIDGANKS